MASWFDLKGTFQTIFRIGKNKTAIDANAPTALRTFYMPDSTVDLRNGTPGQIISQTGANTVGWLDNYSEALVTGAFNDTGSNITKGQVVYFNGRQGDRPKAFLAQANALNTSDKTVGLAYETISTGLDIRIVENGLLKGINTDVVGWTEGDILWLDAAVAGGITNVRPTGANYAIQIGILVRKHVNQGVILVSVDSNPKIDQLQNVSIPTTPTNGQVLTYNSGTGVWYAATPGGGGGSSKFTRGFGIDGFATVGTNKSLPILIPSAVTIQSIKAYARTAPVGAALLFDINKNGTTIFSTPGDRLSIASGANTSTVGTFSTSLAANDVLELDIDQVGSSTFGSDITIVIEVQ